MAQQGIQMDQERLCCSICLDLLKDPVTIPCGHNYCMNCIKSYWDEEDQKKVYSCPQCRQTFRPRPALVKNTMLADLVEELKKTEPQAAPADHCYAGPGDVSCDFCSGRKMKALKSCLQCLVSYCEQHLQPHYESAAFEKHKLVDPSEKLQENICTRHNEVMKIFCRTDQQCICYICSMDEHKGHNTVSAAAEMTEKQKKLGVSQQKIHLRIQDREEDMKKLQQEVEAIDCSADKAVRDSEKIFTDLINLIKNTSSYIERQIRFQQKCKLSQIKELQKTIELELTDLRQKDTELKQLSNIGDHIQFLHKYPSLTCLSKSTDSPSIDIRPVRHFEDVMVAVSEARDKLQDLLSDVWTKISLTETEVDVLLPQAEPTTRAEFLQYSCQMTLDPNTANTELLLSDGNRKATVTTDSIFKTLKMTLDLFSKVPPSYLHSLQVLSRESLNRRCYWEVEWSGVAVSVAVTYTNMRRAVYESGFGNNDTSWTLDCHNNTYNFRHNNISTSISGPWSSRVGVYLDHRAGILSFYSVSETMTLLHRVQTTFTQPLCAGLRVGYDSTAELK
ncbi:tripartite motif-containing protein 16-like [Dicentrarchus labrax]|uniref:tripartite motif-containing protein 16-like n=1 Tax=Dicentrarchus labrax TaxID=13489 RepID=UPI0021F51901|nr:tripartite motif-containing protein 16-like [Dicentrarchus labrax]XP_051267937.1 tripartite motif-containing protein 16-like [Dicentrarchus labrax]